MKMDLALDNLQRLISHKPKQTTNIIVDWIYNCLLRIIIISYLKPYNFADK